MAGRETGRLRLLLSARGTVARHGDRRCHQWGGGGHCLPAQHPHPVSFHFHSGRFRLHGACGLHHGQTDAPHRPARQIVHTHGHGIRLQRARRHGDPYHRKPAQPADHDARAALHVVFGPHPRVCGARFRLLPAIWRLGDARLVFYRRIMRHGIGQTLQPYTQDWHPRFALRHGTSAIPPAVGTLRAAPYVGEGTAIPAQDGRPDTRVLLDCLGVGLFPATGLRNGKTDDGNAGNGSRRRNSRRFLPGTPRAHHHAGVRSHAVRLAHERGHPVRHRCERAGCQHALRDVCRRCAARKWR